MQRGGHKKWKQQSNHKLRVHVKASLHRGDDVIPEIKDVSDVWASPGDGKVIMPDLPKRFYRK